MQYFKLINISSYRHTHIDNITTDFTLERYEYLESLYRLQLGYIKIHSYWIVTCQYYEIF